MEKILLISCLAAVASAIFFPFINLPKQQMTMQNICIYSTNPTRYQPKCFLCPTTAYPNVLQTCVSAAAIPSNVSFAQAACIEQNCMISRGRRSVDETRQLYNLLEDDQVPISPDGTHEVALKDGGNGPKGQQKKFQIVETVELFVSDDDYDDEEYDNAGAD